MGVILSDKMRFLNGLEEINWEKLCDVYIYNKDGKLVTAGGRVLGATKVADTLPEAIRGAYQLVEKIHFGNAYCRKDIGAKALKALEE